jgi:hypothetical protein
VIRLDKKCELSGQHPASVRDREYALPGAKVAFPATLQVGGRLRVPQRPPGNLLIEATLELGNVRADLTNSKSDVQMEDL